MWVLDGTWGMHDGMGWWMAFGAVWMVVFWGAVIGLVVWGMSRLSRDRGSHEVSPLDIATRRYASGAIGRDEFEQLRRHLG